MFAVIVAAVALGATPALAAAPVEAGKVYSGPEGEEVAVVPLTPRSENKFILRIKGTGTEVDGKVLAYELVDESSYSNTRQRYVTTWKGRGYPPFHARNSSYDLWLHGRQRAIPLRYDEKKTAALKSEEVYAQHQKQTADGTLAKLMAFDRKGEQADHDKAYAEVLKELNTTCGTQVSAAIDWSSVNDEQLKDLSISGYCESPLVALKNLCAVSNIAKQTVKEKVKDVSCRFGAAVEPKLEASRVIWTTHKDASNQEQFATGFFKKNL